MAMILQCAQTLNPPSVRLGLYPNQGQATLTVLILLLLLLVIAQSSTVKTSNRINLPLKSSARVLWETAARVGLRRNFL